MDKKVGGPNKNKNSIENISNSIMVESFFSTYILLDTFFSAEFIEKGKAFHIKLAKPHAQEGLRQGFKLLLVATLHEYIDGIIRSPEVVGIEPDFDYRDYWAFTKGRGREITRTTARTDHYISKFVAKANSLINEILTLETWESIEDFGDKTKEFRDRLCQISEKAYIASKGGKKITMRNALLDAANMILWSTLGNSLPIAHRYTDYFISRRDDEADPESLDEIVEECRISSGLTRFDFSYVSRSFFPRTLPEHWALGYAFSMHESLKLLARNNRQRSRLISLDRLVFSTKDWHDMRKYDGKMTTVYGLPKVYRGYRYVLYQKITDDDRQPLMAEVEALPSPERLLSIFGNRARIVERGFPGGFDNFECLLDGAITKSKRTKEAARVAIIVHRDRRGQEDYSTAIFMPAYGMFSNASMWWVYHLIGNNHSGGASHQWRLVFNKIKRNRKAIDLIVVQADEEEFYRYCEDPGYSRLNDAIVLTNKITSDVRGVFPELLLANMLTNLGYTKVLNRIRPRILKLVKGELDTVGIKLAGGSVSHILVFESKGQAHDENELQSQIDRFSDNVSTIQQNLESFCNELKVPYSRDVQIEAIFVSMDTLDIENGIEESIGPQSLFFRKLHIKVPSNIGLWDFNDLLSKLAAAHVPAEYRHLLKRTQVAAIIDPFPLRTPMPGTLAPHKE